MSGRRRRQGGGGVSQRHVLRADLPDRDVGVDADGDQQVTVHEMQGGRSVAAFKRGCMIHARHPRYAIRQLALGWNLGTVENLKLIAYCDTCVIPH